MTLPSPAAPLYSTPPAHVPSQIPGSQHLDSSRKPSRSEQLLLVYLFPLYVECFPRGVQPTFPSDCEQLGLPFLPQSSLLSQLHLSDLNVLKGFGDKEHQTGANMLSTHEGRQVLASVVSNSL